MAVYGYHAATIARQFKDRLSADERHELAVLIDTAISANLDAAADAVRPHVKSDGVLAEIWKLRPPKHES